MHAWIDVRPDSATAAELGFESLPVASILTEPNGEPSFPELDAMTQTERAQWQTALLGSFDDQILYSGPGGVSGGFSAGGCFGNARVELFEAAEGGFGSFLIQRSILEQLRSDAFDRVESSASVEEALATWQDCMANAGFGDYEDPAQLVPALAQLHADGERSSEVMLVVADAACFDQSALIETWDAEMAQAEYEMSQSELFTHAREWGNENYPQLVDTFSSIIEARASGTE